MTELQISEVHEQFISLLAQQGIQINGTFHCLHALEIQCDCRKPLRGMLLKAAEQLDIDLTRSCMLGDKPNASTWSDTARCDCSWIESFESYTSKSPTKVLDSNKFS